MVYKNSEDQRAASKRHYEANKGRYLLRNKRYRKEISDSVNQLKESMPCSDCGKSYPYYVMDFDHVESKLGMISYFAKTGRIGALKREIKKCELVCANCHRERTHVRLTED